MKYSLIAAALLVPLAAPAQAQELSYTYAELGYTRVEGDFESDGIAANGSFAIGDRFHIIGGYLDFELDNRFFDEFDDFDDDFAAFDVGAERWFLGAGYHQPISDSMDLVAQAAYQKTHASGFGSDDGWFGEVGVRSLFTPRIEAWAFAGYEDMEGQSGDVFARLGGQFHFNETWGVVGDARFVDGDQVYFIGPRMNF